MDYSAVEWARGQFALTAMFHFLFVPLTLGLSFILAIMETIYVKTNDPFWKNVTKFWMSLFAVNFAIGVATGLILEFEFGTNWATYSWIVGDIFGAPLAIEGIFAFFLEATFFAVMFFGWERVSKKFHLFSTYMVAFGSNLSALWILVANGWMQYPVGTAFNIDTARNEMVSFWEVILSPVAISKFIHTISSSFVVGALFVAGISAWYLLKGKHIAFAQKSIVVASAFGLVSSLGVITTGDHGAYYVAQTQPMKLAAIEGLWQGSESAGLTLFAIPNLNKKPGDGEPGQYLEVQIPGMLSFLAQRDFNAFVPGIEDILFGNPKYNIEPSQEKIQKGQLAVTALKDYKLAQKENRTEDAQSALQVFNETKQYLGYGYLENIEQLIPAVTAVVLSFKVMVGLGFLFVLVLILLWWAAIKNQLLKKRLLLWVTLACIPLSYLAGQLGWVVAELGRQPWVIQDILPTHRGVTDIGAQPIQITFWIFLVLFTFLFIAEIKILLNLIKKGPQGGTHV